MSSAAVKAFIDAAETNAIDDISDDIDESDEGSYSKLSGALDSAQTAASEAGETMNKVTLAQAEAHTINTIIHSNSLIHVGYDTSTVYSTFKVADSEVTTYSDHFGIETLSEGTYTYDSDSDSDSGSSAPNPTNTLTVSTIENEKTSTDTYTLSLATDDDGNQYLEMTDTSTSTLLDERLYIASDKGAAESYLVKTIYDKYSELYLAEASMSTPEPIDTTEGTAEYTYKGSTPIATFTYTDSKTTVTYTGFYENYLTYTYTDVNYQTETTTKGSGRLYYDSELATAYLTELNSDDSGTDSSDTVGFTEAMVSGQTFYTSSFDKIEFSTNGTVQIFSMLNSEQDEDSNSDDVVDSFAYNIIDDELVIGSDETWAITNVGDTSYTVTLTEGDESEVLTIYTSLEALEAAELSSTLPATKTDASGDSTYDAAGSDLISLAVAETSDSQQIQITLTAGGSIETALATAASHGESYSNVLWIEINDSIEFGMSSDGAWCKTDIYSNGVFTGGTDVSTDNYEHVISEDGTTLTLTIDADVIPENDHDYLVVQADMGEDYNGTSDEDNDDYNYDEVVVAAGWSYDNPLIGAWVSSEDNAPFTALTVVVNSGKYVYAQQVLGEGGVIGGVEAGTYTLTTSGTETVTQYTFSNAIPEINTNADDTAEGATLTVSSSNPTSMSSDVGLTMSKIVSSADPEAGAWIIRDAVDDGTILLVLDGTNYMEVDLNFDETGMYEVASDDGTMRYNATEFGTYTLTNNVFTFSPGATTDPTDTTIICTSEVTSGCNTVAGDSNLEDAGFNDTSDITVTLDGDTITIDVVDSDSIALDRVQ